ncbi:serine protease FAM111B isoform X2 [Sturnira hondurensis]|uniref:serine protease FAM111B isoform X2 n=1 Tax=Sturnira hondurensis TaxID=192404 RepID=UPI0018793A49|nr:serine protease FAM111B isoform X2 [Sturnira hondurensis]
MNPEKCEENKSLGATEKDQPSRPEVAKDIVTKEICSGKRDHSVFKACGGLNESIDSALRADENVLKRIENCFNKNILVYGQEAIEGCINLGMPLKCLPEGSKLEISISQRKGNQKEGDRILRRYENPSIECVLFHVVAIGRTRRKIVRNTALHEMGSTLCIYALKGETLREALCKDGRFRSDLDEFEWRLIESHTNIHGKQSTAEEVAGKTLELDISKKAPVGKRTPLKTVPKNENATGETRPDDVMPRETQVHQPENDGQSEGIEHDQENVRPPQSLGHDLEGKKHQTISRIKKYYRESNRKRGKQSSPALEWPRLRMESAINWDMQEEATHPWVKNCTVLGNAVMLCNPRFREDALWMRDYFEEERKMTKLPPTQLFKIFKDCFGKVTKNSVPVTTCERHTQLSKSVGFLKWENNGITGNATCFVFNEGYIFTCRHVVHFMVGEDTALSLWPERISTCAKVTFTFKEFSPPAEEWFSLEPWLEVSNGGLDYAILKLRGNGNGFPPGLVGHTSSLPPSGLIYIIGHPEGRRKEIDGCAVITRQERERRYSQLLQREVAVGGLKAATHVVCSMFSPRSFPPEAYSTETLSYDTCFTSGSSGCPVFNADGKVVAVHSFGMCYRSEGKQHGFIEFGYAMDSILSDLQQRNKPLYKLLTEEKYEDLNQDKNNQQESSLRDDQIEPMEH